MIIQNTTKDKEPLKLLPQVEETFHIIIEMRRKPLGTIEAFEVARGAGEALKRVSERYNLTNFKSVKYIKVENLNQQTIKYVKPKKESLTL